MTDAAYIVLAAGLGVFCYGIGTLAFCWLADWRDRRKSRKYFRVR